MNIIFMAVRFFIFLLGLVVISAVVLVFVAFPVFLWYTVFLPVWIILAAPICIASSHYNCRNLLPEYITCFITVFWRLPAEVIPDLILRLYEPIFFWMVDDAESSSETWGYIRQD